MKAHAWEYGFVMSYPKGKIDVTCYDFEPWHFRYVGRELAASIHASGLTPREYLWANFTTTVVPRTDAQARPHGAADARPPPSTVEPSRRAIRRRRRCRPPTRRPATPPPTQPAAADARPPTAPRRRAPASPPTGVVVADRAGCSPGSAVVAAALARRAGAPRAQVLRRGRSGVGL